jgi:hypothetical protein
MFWLLMIIPAAIGNYLVLHGLFTYLLASRRASSRMRKEAQGFRLMMTGALLVLITTVSTLITTI